MSETNKLNEYHDESGLYEIRLKGHLNERWADWLGDVVITLEDTGNTLLICRAIDQAALHGLLKRIRDLGMTLLSVNFIKPGHAESKEGKL